MTIKRALPVLAAAALTLTVGAGLATAGGASSVAGPQTSEAGPPASRPSGGYISGKSEERVIRRECVRQSLREFSRGGSGINGNLALSGRDRFFSYHECARRSRLRS